MTGPAVSAFGLRHSEYVSSRRFPSWGVARVVGVKDGRLWLHFQGDAGASTRDDHWHFADLQLIRSWHDPSLVGLEKSAFRLPLEDSTRVVRGPHVSLQSTRRLLLYSCCLWIMTHIFLMSVVLEWNGSGIGVTRTVSRVM